MTRAELGAEVAGTAAELHRLGLRPGDVVGVTIGDDCHHLIVSLALMRLGCPHLVLPTYEPVPYREELARRVGAVAVIAQSADAGFDGIPSVLAPELPAAGAAAQSALPPLPGNDVVCTYIASSGSTGLPKLVPLTHSQLFLQSVAFHGAGQAETYFRPASIEFNNSKRQRLYVLATGGANVFADANREQAIETCRRHAVTLFAPGHARAQAMAEREGGLTAPLPAETELRLDGAPVSRQLRQGIIAKLTARLNVTYGATEAGSIASAGPDMHEIDPDIVGLARPGIELAVVDYDGRPVPDGATGDVRLRGDAVVTDYANDREASARAFRNGWFYPGDRGRLLDGRYLCVEGRADGMMNLATINVYPAEIERVVRALPGVVECAAFSVSLPGFGDVPLVAVVARPPATEQGILGEARAHLGLRAPRKVFLVDSLPRNAVGKVARAELADFVKPAQR